MNAADAKSAPAGRMARDEVFAASFRVISEQKTGGGLIPPAYPARIAFRERRAVGSYNGRLFFHR
jgi:hypothetical protein